MLSFLLVLLASLVLLSFALLVSFVLLLLLVLLVLFALLSFTSLVLLVSVVFALLPVVLFRPLFNFLVVVFVSVSTADRFILLNRELLRGDGGEGMCTLILFYDNFTSCITMCMYNTRMRTYFFHSWRASHDFFIIVETNRLTQK